MLCSLLRSALTTPIPVPLRSLHAGSKTGRPSINTLKTLETRGFNVGNERPVKRRVNLFRHQQQKAQSRATMAQQPHSDGLSATPATSTPPEAMHGSIAMPGALRNPSYARTAHTLLAEIQRLNQPPLPSSP
ncbi:TPA: hypothetical protein ACH3X1_002362 [Trebouxia sp. C0004]